MGDALENLKLWDRLSNAIFCFFSPGGEGVEVFMICKPGGQCLYKEHVLLR